MGKNKIKRTDIVHPDALHEEAYYLIKKHLWSRNEHFWVIPVIRSIRKSLWKYYELSVEDIQHHIYMKFRENKTLEKYDHSLSSLKTYTAHKTLGKIRDMRKSYNAAYGKNREKILRVFHSQNQFIPENYFCLRYENEAIDDKQANDKDDILLVKDQAPILNRLIDNRTPEDILIEKEAVVLLHENFDEVDILVLEDIIDRKEAAERLSLTYDAYCKKLQRKINSFKILASKAGHC